MLHSHSRNLLALIIALIATPVIAENANFDELILAQGSNQGVVAVNGYTSGSYSLSSIANSDKDNNPCFGYGDPTPDHIMTLEQDFPNLKLRVNSRGNQTTLVVIGPDKNTVRCSSGNVASIEDINWVSGKYKVWIGSVEPNQSLNYRLSAKQ